MSNSGKPLPDDEIGYRSPHSDEMLRAIGRVITVWAVAEAAIPLQVARLVAADEFTDPPSFHQSAYLRSAAALMGTAPKVGLTQLQNLAPGRKEALKHHADALLKLKEQRDTLAHSCNSLGGHDAAARFLRFGASRPKMRSEKTFQVEQIDSWADKIMEHMKSIDQIVTEVTGWSWSDIDEGQTQFSAGLYQTAR